MRTVKWDYQHQQVRMIDQRLLPGKFREVSFDSYVQVADAIQQMVVRGAPAIGATAAFGMALAAYTSPAGEAVELRSDLAAAAETLRAARPTAVNLAWAIECMLQIANDPDLNNVNDLRSALLEEAQSIADKKLIELGYMTRLLPSSSGSHAIPFEGKLRAWRTILKEIER